MGYLALWDSEHSFPVSIFVATLESKGGFFVTINTISGMVFFLVVLPACGSRFHKFNLFRRSRSHRPLSIIILCTVILTLFISMLLTFVYGPHNTLYNLISRKLELGLLVHVAHLCFLKFHTFLSWLI